MALVLHLKIQRALYQDRVEVTVHLVSAGKSSGIKRG
jgi:23S rRNA C2498 (ribose-2'-O)-methylase RlmM